MSMNDDILRVLYSEEELEAKCAELGAQISKDYEGKNLLLVSVLKGAVVFMTDLMRHITLHYLKQLLQDRNPNSIRIATLLDKPERRRAAVRADYVGYQVPDEFVVGYGLDYDEKYRNLPYVGILKPEVYEK